MEQGFTLSQVKPMLLACIAENVPAALWGTYGMGKTDLVNEIGRELGAHIEDLTLSTLDPTDMQGLGIIDGDAVKWAKPSWLVALEKYRDSPLSILFIDEVNAGVSPAMLAACLKLILNRKAGPHPLPENVRIIVAGNRRQDRATVTEFSMPMNNRFWHATVIPDLGSWQDWAKGKVDPVICAYLNWQMKKGRNALHIAAEAGGERATATPRSWAQASKFLKAPDAIRFGLIAGLIGTGEATELLNFCKVWQSLPSPESIIADPNGAAIPNEPALLYALVSAVSRHATRTNFDAVATYARRLGDMGHREFETVLITEAIRRVDAAIAEGKASAADDLKQTQGYVAWAARNAATLTGGR
jgi:hypothetical protein